MDKIVPIYKKEESLCLKPKINLSIRKLSNNVALRIFWSYLSIQFAEFSAVSAIAVTIIRLSKTQEFCFMGH